MAECPVCLELYEESSTIPRVLPCGHSACERCLGLLPSPLAHPGSIRCPACNLLMRLPPPPLGPKSLPKNIDLLRYSSCQSPETKPKPKPKPDDPNANSNSMIVNDDDCYFLPPPWTDDALVRLWKPWILLPHSVTNLCTMSHTLVFGNYRSSSTNHGNLNLNVTLFPISITTCSIQSKSLRLTYMTKVIESLTRLDHPIRAQLDFLLQACSMQRIGISRVLGFWMSPPPHQDQHQHQQQQGVSSSTLFLVCERFQQSLSCILNDQGKLRFGLDTVGKLFGIGMIGMELCEVVMSFHSKGVVFACLNIDCFHLDTYGHSLLDLNYVLNKSMCIREDIRDKKFNLHTTYEFLSPEAIIALCQGSVSVGSASDVWSLGYILAVILTGDTELGRLLFEGYYCLILQGHGDFADESLDQYMVWRQRVVSKLEASLLGTKFEPLIEILSSCLYYLKELRPQIRDIWCCIRSCAFEFPQNSICFDAFEEQESKEILVSCLFFWDTGHIPKRSSASLRKGNSDIFEDTLEIGITESSGSNIDGLKEEKDDGDLSNSKGMHSGKFKFDTLQGHHDCITGLAIGGGYLFSSSFDKTVNVWSLQDFSHVQSLRGHEHKVMAVVVVDEIQTLCISGDSGSGVFIWKIGTPLKQELLHKWYEHNDWRYSGIHALAISGGYLYTGSGDQSIKAWSLQDYSLAYTMRGHNSTVSALAVANGVLYSGSWDGSIRLWSLGDHSLLSVLRNDTPEAAPPILSLSAHEFFLVSAHENGNIKIWKNDIFVRSIQVQDGAIFAVYLDTKWLFAGGWSKFIDIQELTENELEMNIRPVASISCDSVVTCLIYWHGKLFVGFPNKDVKVYYYETK